MTGAQRDRIRRGITRRYNEIRLLLREYRDCQSFGDSIGQRARLERVAMHRDAIADARLALRLNRTVQQGEAHSNHYSVTP